MLRQIFKITPCSVVLRIPAQPVQYFRSNWMYFFTPEKVHGRWRSKGMLTQLNVIVSVAMGQLGVNRRCVALRFTARKSFKRERKILECRGLTLDIDDT